MSEFNLSCVKGDLVLGLLLLSVGSSRALEVHLNGFLRLRLLTELESRFLEKESFYELFFNVEHLVNYILCNQKQIWHSFNQICASFQPLIRLIPFRRIFIRRIAKWN